MRLPEEQFPAQDQDLQQRLPVEEIVEQVNALLRAHGLEAQLTSFSVMHRRFADIGATFRIPAQKRGRQHPRGRLRRLGRLIHPQPRTQSSSAR